MEGRGQRVVSLDACPDANLIRRCVMSMVQVHSLLRLTAHCGLTLPLGYLRLVMPAVRMQLYSPILTGAFRFATRTRRQSTYHDSLKVHLKTWLMYWVLDFGSSDYHARVARCGIAAYDSTFEMMASALPSVVRLTVQCRLACLVDYL